MRKHLNETFAAYVKKYDQQIPMIDLKYHHAYRVAELAEKIAVSLQLSEEDQELAYVIGLLHDIGRFQQVEDYDSTDDKYMDHADFGVYLLFDENLIYQFYNKENNFAVIAKAIANHNKKNIAANYNKRERLFAKIIRDADKLDIFYLTANDEIVFWKAGFEVSPLVWQNFIAEKPIDYRDMKTLADQLLLFLAFVYDLNFHFSFDYLKNTKYLEIIMNKYNKPYNFDFNLVRQKIMKYLDYYSQKTENAV